MRLAACVLTTAFIISLLGGCSAPEEKICTQVAQLSHSAVTPVSRGDQNNWWSQRHQGVLDQIQQRNPQVIFIGDSITHGWDKSGKEIWDRYYARYDAINMGFSGDHTQHVLWRLENGEVDGISPKLAVLMIGTNNSNGTDNTAQEIADGIQTIVCTLRSKLPQTKILILSIFPRGSAEQRKAKGDAVYNPQWAKNDEASRLASRIADGKMIHYLDINKAFLNDEGILTAEVMPDLLHPREKGYLLWAQAMEPTLQKLLK